MRDNNGVPPYFWVVYIVLLHIVFEVVLGVNVLCLIGLMGIYVPCIFLMHYGAAFGHDDGLKKNEEVLRKESLCDAVKVLYIINMGTLYLILTIDIASLFLFWELSEEITKYCVLSILWPLMLPLLLINHKGKWIGFAAILLLIPILIGQVDLEQTTAEGTISEIVGVVFICVVLAGASLLLSITISKRLVRKIIAG